LPCGQDGVTCLAWLGASSYGCVDGKVRLWDSRSGECVKTLKGHSDAIQKIFGKQSLLYHCVGLRLSIIKAKPLGLCPWLGGVVLLYKPDCYFYAESKNCSWTLTIL